jgi:hypothetical protein
MANSQLEILRRENLSLREAADNSMLNQHDLATGENLCEMNSQLQNATISVLEVCKDSELIYADTMY